MSTFSTNDSTVNSFYLAFYGRPADPAGLKFWSAQLAANNGDMGAIVDLFAASEEAQVRFGTDTVADRITEIYSQLFNRTPDAEGMAFWTNAIEQGHASLADIAMSIQGGAQGSDATLSQLRKQAADAFTAKVEADGSQYSGYASIEAARILVRAVTADATQADLDTLVNAAVSFADTATKTPQVVEAIAVNTTLLALFDTARGVKEPVALAKALADTAKAAAGDPVTLESLLRGGGMDKVLKVMPAAATLEDVVKALADGGLPAAVEVVYPTAPSTPAPTPAPAKMQLTFDSVAQGPDDHRIDTTTNVKLADVTFKYTGPDLVKGQYFQYSIDGETWFREGIVEDRNSNTVKIEQLDLRGMHHDIHASASTMGFISGPETVTTNVQLRAMDGNTRIAFAQEEIIYDGVAPFGELLFLGIQASESEGDTTTEGVVSLDFELLGEPNDGFIEYRMKDGNGPWIVLDSKYMQDGAFTIPDVDLRAADQTVQVRLIDAAGNIGARAEEFIDGNAVAPTFIVMPSLEGLRASTDAPGTFQLVDGKDVSPLALIESGTEDGLRVVTIAAQDKVAVGTLQFQPASGAALSDPTGITFILGTDGGDTMAGKVVWGFAGDDIIAGTDGDDVLIGGEGNDTINGGLGKDDIYGGAGGDLIDMGLGNAPGRVYYGLEGTEGEGFVDGGGTDNIDKISNFGVGDSIHIDNALDSEYTPILHTGYLGELSAPGDYAVVRGSDADGVFTQGAGATDDDYMVQWMVGDVVNSTILHNYGTEAPNLVATPYGNTLLLEEAVKSEYVGSVFNLSSSPNVAWLLASNSYVTGLVDPTTFKLVDYRTGSEKTLVDYDALPSHETTHGGSTLHFKSSLGAGVYKMSWGNGTFSTNDGFLNAAEVYFAGGNDGAFYHRGFELDAAPTIIDADVLRSNEQAENEGFITDGLATVRIHTGGGNDVIVDQGSDVTVFYDKIDDDAQDLIFGFDKDDAILLVGDAAAAVNKDDDDAILWAQAGDDIVSTTEGAVVKLNDYITIGSAYLAWLDSGDELLQQLDTKLDVSEIALNDYLLILAQGAHGDSNVLLVYQNLDNSGTIQQGELSTIAMFANGAITTDNIQIVGIEQDGILPV